jgi:hypothetical protein
VTNSSLRLCVPNAVNIFQIIDFMPQQVFPPRFVHGRFTQFVAISSSVKNPDFRLD